MRLIAPARGLFNVVLGGVLSQFLLSALVVVGYLSRRAARETASVLSEDRSGTASTRWFVREEGRRLFSPLGENLKLGFGISVNTFVVLLPATGLWLFSWNAGWNISFYKQYEQFYIGLLSGLLGVGCFTYAMSIIPLAQARHAFTGSWRSFYDLPFLRRMAKAAPFGGPQFALSTTLMSLPLTMIAIAPTFFESLFPSTAAMTEAEAREFFNSYLLLSSCALFVLAGRYKRNAARYYSLALRRLGEQDQLSLMHPKEVAAIERYRPKRLPSAPGMIPRIARAGIGRVLGLALGLTTTVLYSTLGLQVYLAQFFNYRALSGWLNHPLVNVPCLLMRSSAMFE